MKDSEISSISEQEDDQPTRPRSYKDFSRRDIRSLIFHLIYAMDAFEYQVSLEAILENFNKGFELDIPLDSEVFTIAQGVINDREALDEQIKPLLINWRFERLGLSTKLILRQALWELLNTETPASIIINEAIELAKCFSEVDAYKFVNGILDEVVKSLGRTDNEDQEKTSES